MDAVTLTNGVVLLANDECIDTIVIGESGVEYIRTSKGVWEIYKAIELPMTINTVCDDGNMKMTRCPRKRVRQPTAYNKFLKSALRELSEKHPEMACKERMKVAAERWREFGKRGAEH